MINDIRLYIDKEQVEFKNAPDILYNWTETDFTNPITTKNSYSKTITIDGTKQNNKIFGQFWNLERYQLYGGNTGADFNPSYKVPFTLYVNGNLFEKGYVKLQKVNENKGNLSYEIGLFGGLGSFLYNLSVNEDDGSIKTFNSLNFYLDNSLVDFGFHINKETVKTAWDNINNSSSKWSMLNFAPAYTGIPEKFDANKVLINFKDISASTLTQKVFEDNVYYYPQGGSFDHTEGFAIGELSDSLDSWQVKDLRSYMQVPVIRVKSIFDALQRPENSKGKFDDGYELILDQDFFNENNPYYEDAFITLPKITTLTFTEDGGEQTTITAFTSTTRDVESTYGVTENTTITFDLPNTINTGGSKAVLTFHLYNTVTRPGTAHPNVQTLYLQPTYLGPELLWYSESRTALGAQLLAYAENNSLLTGSSINWYTSINLDGKYFSCSDAINYGTYVPVYGTTQINKKTGSFTFVQTATTGSIYSFTPIEIEMDIPSGTKKISLNVQRCPEKGEGDETMYGNKLFEYGNRDTTELTYYGNFNSGSSSGSTDIVQGGSGENNFFSNRYVKQSELFTTDYSISDWLISYCKMFGLYIHKDVAEDKIYIDTRNNYYQKNLVEDISGLIDYSKDFTINPIYISNKFYTLTNPIEKSKYSETYLSNNGNDYGMKLINTGFEFDANRKELLDNFKIKTGIPVNKQNIYNFKPNSDGINPYVYNGFTYKLYANGDIDYEKTHEIEIDKKQIAKAYRNLFFDNDYPYYDSFYKMCFEDEGKEINSSSIFLFLNGFKDVTDFGYYLTDDLSVMSKLNNNPCWIMTKSETSQDGASVGISLSQIPLFSSYYAPEGQIMFSSNFGSPRELFVRKDELTNNDSATLYSQFYSTYYEDLFDINTKVVDCYVMPQSILTGEYLRRFYWFNNGIWRLNKITDYSPVENRTVKCQFVKIQDMKAISNVVPNKNGYLTVTLNKYIANNEGETIQGRVTTNRDWVFEGADYSDVTVTPSNGEGSTNISVRVPFYSTTQARNINLRFRAGNETVVVTIQQPALTNKYFKWSNESTAITITHDYTSGEELTAYDTNYTQDEYGFLPTTTSVMKNPALLYHRNNFSFSFDENSGTTQRQETINIVRTSDSGVLATLTFIQYDKEEPVDYYFIWNATQTSAYTSTLADSFTSLTASYDTNYENVTFTPQSSDITYRVDNPQQITALFSANTGTVEKVMTINVYDNNTLVGYLTITQEAPSIEYYFYWDETQTSEITSRVNSATTSTSKAYTTNYENITFTYGDFITGLTDNNNIVEVSFNENPVGSTERSSVVTVNSDGTEIGTFTVIQNGGEELYFYWVENNESALTANVNSADTSVMKAYATNYPNITFNYGEWITSVVDNTPNVTVNFEENPVGASARTKTISVLSDGTEIGTLTIRQSAGEDIYFYWVENNSSAITINNIEWDTSYIAKECRTNIPLITFGLDSTITGASINASNTFITASFGENPSSLTRYGILQIKYGSTVYGQMDISQKMREYVFKWDETDDDSYFDNVTNTTTSFTATYTTDYPNVTFSAETGITAVEPIGETGVTIRFEANTGFESKELRLYPMSLGRAIGLLKVTQAGATPYFYWTETNESGITANVGSASTQITKSYSTNISGLYFEKNGMIDSISNNNNMLTAAYSANTVTSARTGYVNVYNGNDLVGVFNITQDAERYFYWNDTQTSSISATAGADVNFVTKACTTNMTAFTFSGSDIVTGGSVNASNTQITGLFTVNPYFYSRTGVLTIKDGNEEVGYMNITQNAKTHTFKFDENDSDTLRVTVNSATTSYTATYTTDYDNINYTCEDCTAEQVGQNGVTAKFTANNTGVERWLRVYIKSGETTIGLLWIIQEG